MTSGLRLRGKPVTWFTPDRSSRSHQTHLRKERNEQLPCDVCGCGHHRDGLSRLCGPHARRLKQSGDPIAQLPTAREIDILAAQIRRECLTDDPERRVALEDAVRRISRPTSWAAPPSEMHRRIPQRGRAEIVKAHVLKRGGDLCDAVVYALAVERWAAAHFDGVGRYRERFIETQAGRWFTQRGTPRTKREIQRPRLDTTTVLYTASGPKHPRVWETQAWIDRAHISGSVRRLLGREMLVLARKLFK